MHNTFLADVIRVQNTPLIFQNESIYIGYEKLNFEISLLYAQFSSLQYIVT